MGIEKITPEEFVVLLKNFQYVVYGLGIAAVAIGAVSVLFGFVLRHVYKYIWRKLEQFDDIQNLVISISTRMDGIGSFAEGVTKLKNRLDMVERICFRNHGVGITNAPGHDKDI